jgi:purine-binding chemotaxis protein CheW
VGAALIARVGALACAIPIEHVVETMRPLPVDPIGAMPAYVLGVSIIRGAPTLAIDLAALLGVAGDRATRFVVVRSGESRRVALAVDAVVEVRELAHQLGELPPLLHADAIRSIAAADRGLVVVLEATRAIAPEVWSAMEART